MKQRTKKKRCDRVDFFFQAEDGIRDRLVTGVQTCALPIYGDWSMGLAEYTISPHWFFAVQDLYNWGNKNPKKQLHYFNANVGYIKGSNRFTIGYGKKREGIFCVGGDRKSTRLNSSHKPISYAVFCLKKNNN